MPADQTVPGGLECSYIKIPAVEFLVIIGIYSAQRQLVVSADPECALGFSEGEFLVGVLLVGNDLRDRPRFSWARLPRELSEGGSAENICE